MPNITNETYTSRTYQAGDEHQIVAMYNLLTGRKRTVAEHLWEWTASSDGIGSMWVILERSNNTIVGHHGLIPIPLNYRGERMLMGKTENTLVHPHYQGKILYFLYERDFLEEAKERFDLLYTTQSIGTPGRIRLKLGYVGVGGYASYVKYIKLAGLKHRIKQAVVQKFKHPILKRGAIACAWLLSPLMMLGFNRTPRIRSQVKLQCIRDIAPFVDALDELWQRSKEDYPITIDRTSKYLKWRIFDNPHVDYDFLGVFRDEQLVGYAILEYHHRDAFVVDLIVDQNAPDLFDATLQAVVRHLREADIDAIKFHTLAGCSYVEEALSRNGFYTLQQVNKRTLPVDPAELTKDNYLLVKPINSMLTPEIVGNPDNWYFTRIFTEGLKIA